MLAKAYNKMTETVQLCLVLQAIEWESVVLVGFFHGKDGVDSAGFVLSAPRLCEDRLLCWEFHIETRFNNGSTPLHVVLTPKCEGVGCRTPGHKRSIKRSIGRC